MKLFLKIKHLLFAYYAILQNIIKNLYKTFKLH